jgi:AcrR family transcriptional regulator
MPRNKDTKRHIVDTALKLFASRGYHNTGIGAIAKESGCTKATLYHHFSCKEALGYAAIDEALRRFVRERARQASETNEHPIDRLLRAVAIPSVGDLPPAGCSPTDVAVRMAAVHEGFREHLETIVAPLVLEMERIVAKGIADGQIADSVNPRQLAHLVFLTGAGIQLSTLLFRQEALWGDARPWLRDFLNSLRK